MSRKARMRDCARDQSGGPATEFALVLPVMLLLLTGIVEFGLTLNNFVTLTGAVGTGAQLFGQSAPQSGTPPAEGACAIQAGENPLNCPYSAAMYAIQQAAPALTWATLAPNVTFTVAGTVCAAGVTTSGDSACFTALKTAAASSTLQPAKVSATYPCTLGLLGFQGYVPACNLGAQTTEVVQ